LAFISSAGFQNLPNSINNSQQTVNNENFPTPKSQLPNPHFGKRKTVNGKRGDEAANRLHDLAI